MNSVTIVRPRHPLEGQTLGMLGRMRRHGRLELLVVLPDGSKTLVPAGWTDLVAPVDVVSASATVATPADLGRAVTLVAELLTRVDDPADAGCTASTFQGE